MPLNCLKFHKTTKGIFGKAWHWNHTYLEILGIRSLKNLEAFKGENGLGGAIDPIGLSGSGAKKGGRRVATAALSLGRKRPRRAYATSQCRTAPL
jgi:hypothetical protein